MEGDALNATAQTVDDIIDEDLAAPPPSDLLRQLISGAEQLRELIKERDHAEAVLKELNAKVFKLQNEQLPALFDSAGIKEIGLADGKRLQRSEEIYASCAKDRQPLLAQWCEDHGYESIVRGQYTVPVAKGDVDTASRVSDALRRLSVKYAYDRSVHPSTLRAFVKERVRAAQPVPEMITYHIQPTCGWHISNKETGNGE
jgi:hypothetical protein